LHIGETLEMQPISSGVPRRDKEGYETFDKRYIEKPSKRKLENRSL